MSDRSKWKHLIPAFTAAVRNYRRVSKVRLLSAQRREAITAPLYHYTDRKRHHRRAKDVVYGL